MGYPAGVPAGVFSALLAKDQRPTEFSTGALPTEVAVPTVSYLEVYTLTS